MLNAYNQLAAKKMQQLTVYKQTLEGQIKKASELLDKLKISMLQLEDAYDATQFAVGINNSFTLFNNTCLNEKSTDIKNNLAHIKDQYSTTEEDIKLLDSKLKNLNTLIENIGNWDKYLPKETCEALRTAYHNASLKPEILDGVLVEMDKAKKASITNTLPSSAPT